jgi:hypothetical protein
MIYILNFFKKGDTIKGGTLFKEIQYSIFYTFFCLEMRYHQSFENVNQWLQRVIC